MTTELEEILRAYEQANNSHEWGNVEPFIHPKAVYWFTDGKHNGVDEIREAVTTTFNKIKEETYSITNINWLATTDTVVGDGRGTNVFVNENNSWKIIHEHLST